MLPHEAKNNKLQESQLTKLFQPGGRLTWKLEFYHQGLPFPMPLTAPKKSHINKADGSINNSIQTCFLCNVVYSFEKNIVYSLGLVGNLTSIQ